MRRLTCLTVLLWGVGAAAAQTATGGKIDPTWLRTDAASKTVDFKLVAGLTDNNGGMNFNGFSRGGLVLTVPQGWTVALHFKSEDPNLPHSVEIIPVGATIPTGPVAPAFGAEGALHARAPRRRTRRRGAWLGQAHVPVACFGVPSRVGAPSPDPQRHAPGCAEVP